MINKYDEYHLLLTHDIIELNNEIWQDAYIQILLCIFHLHKYIPLQIVSQ